MKIVAINASYRGDKGHTCFLIDKLFAGATAAEGDQGCFGAVRGVRVRVEQGG